MFLLFYIFITLIFHFPTDFQNEVQGYRAIYQIEWKANPNKPEDLPGMELLWKESENIEYELLFTQTKSIYSVVKAGDLDGALGDLLDIISNKNKTYYNDQSLDLFIMQEKRDGNLLQVNNYQSIKKWNLQNEAVTIAGMRCKKAIGMPINMVEKMKIKPLEVRAWYTEEIPVSFGPGNYNGLPGLILMIENDAMMLKLKKIDKFNIEEKLLIPRKPTHEMEYFEYAIKG